MSVKIARMTSGEQVIADVSEKLEGGYTFKNPALLVPHGQGQLGLAPWMPYAEPQGIDIPQDHVSFLVVPLTDLINEYNQAFGSGIIVPDKNLSTPNLKLTK